MRLTTINRNAFQRFAQYKATNSLHSYLKTFFKEKNKRQLPCGNCRLFLSLVFEKEPGEKPGFL